MSQNKQKPSKIDCKKNVKFIDLPRNSGFIEIYLHFLNKKLYITMALLEKNFT